MKKPSNEILLQQLNRLEKWCIAYLEQNPRNHGTYSGGVCRDTYKPLRDGIVFYSSGWGWRLRKNWQQAIAEKRVELQAAHDRLVAWFKGEAHLTMREADVLVRCADCGALIETDVHCDNCGSFHPTRG
jgi:hypothetical protein